MINLYKYTDKELSQLLKSLVILSDTREKENRHILHYLDTHKIPYLSYKLDYGDYSVMLPANKDLGISRDIYFDNQIVVERKGSLEELSGNISKERVRFENELIRASKTKVILMVENSDYSMIERHKYITGLSSKAFLATLFTYTHRFNIHVDFIRQESAGQFIYGHCA